MHVQWNFKSCLGLYNGHYVRRNLTKPLCIQCFEKLFRQLPSSTGDSTYAERSKLLGLVLKTKSTRVKPTEVEDCFTEDIMPDFPDDQNCNKFVDYLLENYVEFNSKFTPDM